MILRITWLFYIQALRSGIVLFSFYGCDSMNYSRTLTHVGLFGDKSIYISTVAIAAELQDD